MNATRAPNVTPGFKRMQTAGSGGRVSGTASQSVDGDRIERDLFCKNEASPEERPDLLKEKSQAWLVEADSSSEVRPITAEEARTFLLNRSDPAMAGRRFSVNQALSCGSDRSNAAEETMTGG